MPRDGLALGRGDELGAEPLTPQRRAPRSSPPGSTVSTLAENGSKSSPFSVTIVLKRWTMAVATRWASWILFP